MEKVKLGDACVFIRNGVNIKNDKGKLGIPITRIETIANGVIDEDSLGYANIFDEKYEDYYLRQNDILMSHINSMKHLGKVAICNEDKKIIHGMNLLSIRLKENILAKYVYYFFKTNSFKKQLHKISKQSVNQSSFNVNDLKKISIDLPDYKTQNRIAYIMDKVQEVIDIRENQIKQLDELIKSQFVEMFGELSNSKYQTVKLSYIADVGSSHRVFTTEFVEKGIPFYRGTEIGMLANGEKPKDCYYISEEHYSKICDESTKPKMGDLLLPSICNKGQVWMVDTTEPFYYKDGRVLSISPKEGKINNKYFHQFMKYKTIKEYSKLGSGSTFAEFKIFILKDFDVILPPIELQNKFAEFVKQIDKQKFEIRKSLEEIQKLQESLMNKYFG